MNAKLIRTSAMIGAITALFVLAISVVPTATSASISGDGDCCGYDYYSTSFPEYDQMSTSYDQYDYLSTSYPEYDYYSTSYPEYDYYSTSYPEYDYYSTSFPEYDYYSTSYPEYDYYSTSYPENGQYDYGYGSLMGGGSYGGGSYGGGGYSTGGGYAIYPTSGYPKTIYQPTYNRPTPTTPSTPSNTSVVNNNTNTNTNTNTNNNTAIAVAQVQIGGQQYTQPNYPTYPAPNCTISHTQYTAYNYGSKQIYLTWSASNASSAYLSGYGSVAVNGSQTVYSAANQTYTLTVYGYNGQQATCQTTVYGTTYTPTPYVSLTQIPYTGFDFGPFGNAMYWAGLISVALAGAYLAVYYIPGVAFAGTNRRAFAPVVAAKAPILVEKEAALEKINPIVTAIRKAGTNDAMAIVKSLDGSMPKIVIERY